jgi:hypothetical protein
VLGSDAWVLAAAAAQQPEACESASIWDWTSDTERIEVCRYSAVLSSLAYG